jgi:glycosyltransferase involved in cell wall biosynthesis
MTQVAPKITIIVAVYNAKATLQQCINSVVKQSYQHVELIIIDGASTDGSIDVIKQNKHHISYWVSETDTGIYNAWNKGLAKASGDWVAFLGADDFFWQENTLEQIANAVNLSDSLSKLIYGKVALVNSNEEVLYQIGEPWESTKVKLGDVMAIPHPGMLHHRSWFIKYGFFDTSFKIAGDYEMLLRGWPQENAIFTSNIIVVGMAQGGVSSTPKNALRQLKEVWLAQKKYGKKYPGWRLLLAFLRVIIRLALQTLLSERLMYSLLDLGRKLMGKQAYWTKI